MRVKRRCNNCGQTWTSTLQRSSNGYYYIRCGHCGKLIKVNRLHGCGRDYVSPWVRY